jgi:hypothetical protein
VKVIPVQMHYSALTRLLQPFGTLSPMGVLWASMGSARPYEIFASFAEVAGGLLLIVPRTTILGALISFADMIQVDTLNMTYDVPVNHPESPCNPQQRVHNVLRNCEDCYNLEPLPSQ